jgi:erythromycin esterase-like protein
MPASPTFASIAPRAAHPVDARHKAVAQLAAQAAARASIVLIGEASHGTQEFYEMRAALTRELIEAHGFRAVALEADWPDTSRAHRYVRGRSDDANADEALSDFHRFPRWMWRNEVMRNFVEWLAEFNRAQPLGEMAGVFGLDLYSLHASIEAVLEYLDRVDPQAAAGLAAATSARFTTDAAARSS